MNAFSSRSMLMVFFLVVCGVYANPAIGQASVDGIWNDIPESAISSGVDRMIVPLEYRTLALNMPGLGGLLSQAPMEGSVSLRTSPAIVNLPLPNGEYGTFRVVESPIMAPQLAVRYPEIRTYLGQGIADPTATVRFDITPAGFHAMILSSGPAVYIDPYARGSARHYISYYRHALMPQASRSFDEIGVIDDDGMGVRIAQIVASGAVTSIGEELRTYRLAVAATGEYTVFHGGTVQAGMAAIVTAMNRVNGIYEREVAVRMQLVANNDLLVYTNPSTDPYTNSSGFTMLSENQNNLDNIIGDANYDIGHVFSTGGGGVAGLGVVCGTSVKARGVTGLPSPIGDPFYVDYVAHEMGHQFGANHTFNGNTGSCSGGNRHASTAYEPGSGTTIMAYAGICGSQNIQTNSDDYFHGASIDEMVAFTTLGGGNNCPVITQTGNNPPVVNAGASGLTLPKGTPFVLTGSAVDPDNDTLTYTWEEFDLGPAGHPNTPSGNAPIFRSFKGTTNPSRTFPRLFDLMNNTQTIGEILPSYGRPLNFRLTARDNRAGGGGVGKASTSFSVTDFAGPFTVLSPNGGGGWLTNSTDTVWWDVANTNNPPVNCSHVNILLSTNGGQTFGITLATNTPNDGMEAVAVPDLFTESARVKIEAVSHIFFDISNTNFAVARVTSPVLAFPPDSSLNQPTSLTFRWGRVQEATSYHLQVSSNSLFTSPLVNDSTLTDTTRTVTGLTNNFQYYWRVKAKNNDDPSGWSRVWTFRTVPPAPAIAPNLISPPNNSTHTSLTLTLQWGIVFQATSYRVEVATDTLFTATVIDDSVAALQRVVTLPSLGTYYWRVRARNAGGFGPTSAVWSFTLTPTSVPQSVALPTEFGLSQNYPNPFNPTTVIAYALPHESYVKLEVFNLLGERVATLRDQTLPAGYYSDVFDGAGMASGMYYYRLTAHTGGGQGKDLVGTRRLVLMK